MAMGYLTNIWPHGCEGSTPSMLAGGCQRVAELADANAWSHITLFARPLFLSNRKRLVGLTSLFSFHMRSQRLTVKTAGADRLPDSSTATTSNVFNMPAVP